MQHYKFPALLLLMFLAGWLGHQWLLPSYSSSLFSIKLHNSKQENLQRNIIYEAPAENLDEPILVRSVSLIQNRPEQIMLEIEYTYKGAIPAEQVKLFVHMGSSYTYIGSTDIVRGTHKRRINIELIASDLRKDNRYEFTTHDISMSFEHYLPDKYMGVITRTMFPYEKHWQLIE
ncbi:hypothetical protein [Cellvibrio sp. UBA7661]|uniref:hypothetical protein n=1 Tax=Cellvibrio sp. UBA7661 TaxID=1946311 RepID=UPI002F35E459